MNYNSILKTAYVYVNNKYAGLLKQDEDGYSFKYDENYISKYNLPVSLTLPIKKEEYKSNVLFPFFDGLIPEGWLLEVICHNWKLSEKDRFGILLVACNDCIGNVSIQSEYIGEEYE